MNRIHIALANALLVATVSLPQTALSEPLEVVSDSQAGNLVCYIQTDKSQTVDLTPLCSPRGSNGLLAPRGTVNYDKVPGFKPRKERTYGTGSFAYIPSVSSNPWGDWSYSGGGSSGGGSSGGSSKKSSGGSSGKSGGGSSGGTCGSPGGTASDGSSCGLRSAESRPGGR